MSPTMTAPLALEPQGDGWRLGLRGDWSLAAMPQIEAQLQSLPAGLHGILLCDWSQAAAPGIGPAWALLERLADGDSQPSEVRHTGGPPHFLEVLQKLQLDRHAPERAAAAPTTLRRLIGKLGLWSV